MDISNSLYKAIRIFMQVAVFSMLAIKVGFSSMGVVFLIRRPFKVFNPVVSFVSVLVIDSLAIFGGVKERLSNNLMDVAACLRVESNGKIPFFSARPSKQFFAQAPFTSVDVVNFSFKCFDTAKRRNSIARLKAENRLPNFMGHIGPIHHLCRL